MKFRFFRHLLLLFILTSGIIIGEVPAAKTRKPNIPYLGQSINFQTIEMKIFSPFTTGMFPDRYSDLILNPASIMSNDTTSLYLDFNADNYENPVLSPLVLNELYDTQTISPRWYGYTTRSSVQTNPLYNFAALVPLSSTLSFSRRVMRHVRARRLTRDPGTRQAVAQGHDERRGGACHAPLGARLR